MATASGNEQKFGSLLRDEPALASGLVQAVIALVIAFGVSLSADQVGSIMAAVAVVSALAVRWFVTPTSKLTPQIPPGTPPDLPMEPGPDA